MRAYFFGNMYLSSIQQGIQASHVVTKLFRKYETSWYNGIWIEPTQNPRSILHDWADNHVTKILCNAGYGSEIRSLEEFFTTIANPYPFISFCEEASALDGAITSIGIVLPAKIYEDKELKLFKSEMDAEFSVPRLVASACEGSELLKMDLDPQQIDSGLYVIRGAGNESLTSYDFAMAKRIKQYSLAR